MIDNLKDHYIICGFGRVGRGAAAELHHAGVPFVVVDIPERVERAILAGMLAVAADATHDETLRQVGIERARGLVAALATDADNLFVLLSAKGLNPRIYVAARAAEEGAEEKMRRAGADAVFAPYSSPATAWRSRYCGRTSCSSSTSPPKTSARTSPSSRCAFGTTARWFPKPSRNYSCAAIWASSSWPFAKATAGCCSTRRRKPRFAAAIISSSWGARTICARWKAWSSSEPAIKLGVSAHRSADGMFPA